MLRWERKAVVVNVLVAFILAMAVLKASAWVDMTFYRGGEIRAAAVANYRSAIGAQMALAEKKEPKRRQRRHR